LSHQKWGSLAVEYTVRDGYAYFREYATYDSISGVDTEQLVTAEQFNGSINPIKVKFQNDIHFLRNLGLANTLMYQNVSQSENILNVPELTTRQSLYYSNHLFQKALYLQTGIEAK